MDSMDFEALTLTKVKGHGKRKRRKHTSRKRLAYGVAAVALIISGLLIYFSLHSSNQNNDHTSQPRAAIVDHLSISQPNQTFVQTSMNILRTAGFYVHYYAGGARKSDVDFYRDLPTQNFKLIIFRVHSALHAGDESDFVAFFTSEKYSSGKYFWDEYHGRLVICQFHVGEQDKYFGISPLFIRDSLDGRFDDTTVIVMGCDGLKYTSMAEAFIKKGAKVYISWNGPVSARHTDQTTAQLLKHLLTEKETIKEAVAETMKAVGQDPEFNESTLLYYPRTLDIDNYAMLNHPSESALSVTENHGSNHTSRREETF